MPKLVFIRHGQSEWNLKNLFTGWEDVNLSEKGVEEAKEAGRKLKEAGIEFDQAYTSVLTRAIKTLHFALEESGQLWIPEMKTWRLNERHYGALQGKNKADAAEKYGDEQVHIWRRSYDVLPPLLSADDEGSAANDRRYADLDPRIIPGGENLKVTLERVIPFWEDHIAPDLLAGKNVIVAAHGNSLRALTKYIEQISDESKLMLILCGSSMSYMEDHVLAYKAPLYGRRTAQMKILPFNFEETCHYFKNFTGEEKAYVYGIVGGTPQYLLQMSDKLSIEDNIKNTFLSPNSALFEEPENLLKQEVREPALYNAIITAIATGASRMSEISAKVGESTNICSAYVKNLISLGIIEKETPYGEKASRKAIYSIADNMFRFWYRFVPENNSIIARGAADLAYKRIEPHLSDYIGKVFEEICKQYLWKLLLSGECPVEFSSLGRWWGNDPKEKRQTEIDILAEQDKKHRPFRGV